MNNYKRHKVFLIYLQASQKSCSFRKRRLYYEYAVSQVKHKETKKIQQLFVLQKFFLFLLPLMVIASNQEILLDDVVKTLLPFFLFLLYLEAGQLQEIESCCFKKMRTFFVHTVTQVKHLRRKIQSQEIKSCCFKKMRSFFKHPFSQVNYKEKKKLLWQSLGSFFILDCILLLPVVVMTNNEEILLNEIATSSKPPFIELRKISDKPFLDLSKYGIVIAEKMTTRNTKNTGQLKVRLVLGLRGGFQIFPNYEIIHYGNIQNHPSILDPPPNPQWRVFGAFDGNDWLDVKNKNFLAIFLTKSDRDIMDVIKMPASGRQDQVYIVNAIKQYMQESVIDFLVVRNGNGPSDDEMVNEIIEGMSPRTKRMPLALHEFVTQYTDNPPTSISRCGEFEAFDLRGFMNTERTPREVNSCDDYQPKFVAEDHLPQVNLMNVESELCDDILSDEDVDMMQDEQDELCNEEHETNNEKDSDCEMFSLATGLDEQQSNDEIKKNIDVTNEEVCVTESVLSQRQAELELEIDRIVQLKRKLKNDRTYNDMEWTIGHPDFDIWIPQIQTYQSSILPLDLIKRVR